MQLNCPICGPSARKSFYAQRSGYRLQKCHQCGLVFLETMPEEMNAAFYADADDTPVAERQVKDNIEYWSFPQHYEKHRTVFEHFFAERWQNILAVNPKVESVLDIGCGYGFFLNHIKSRVKATLGIELDHAVAEYARKAFGLTVYGTRIEEFKPPTLVDCITMCDVLEHLADPVAALKRCHDFLTPSGVLFLQVPNLVGFKLPPGHGWGLPHHIWQFGHGSLASLVEQCGFRVVDWQTGVLGVIGVYERGGPTIWERLLWALARRFKLGNRLVLICVKDARTSNVTPHNTAGDAA